MLRGLGGHRVRVRTPRADDLARAMAPRAVSVDRTGPDEVEVEGLPAEDTGALAHALGVPFHETCQDGSWSRHLAEATLTHELSLPVAVPVAAQGGLTWVSSGLVYRPAATRLGRLGRERGQVARGAPIPVEPGAAVLAHELPLGESELGSHRTTEQTP